MMDRPLNLITAARFMHDLFEERALKIYEFYLRSLLKISKLDTKLLKSG